ncbi:MAG: hypothetical protein JO264_07080 [Acidisphaera sp.]|nr:hypothetical protein [Acidisphaera sp.]
MPLALLALIAAAPPPSATPTSRLDEPAWAARHAAKLEEVRRKHPDLIFLGDSITQNWEKHGGPAWDDFAPGWQRFYGRRNAVNLGFSGDTTANLLWRIENGEVDGISPRAAVVLIGVNDFGGPHWSVADTLAGILAVVAALHARLPSTHILLLGVLPNAWSDHIAAQTAALDAALRRRDWAPMNATCLDLSHIFLRNGVLDRSLFFDPLLDPPQPPLHPTAQAQERLSEAIEPALLKILK